MSKDTYENAPRDYALELVEERLVTADHLALCCLRYMSADDVRDMLDCNELSPRFDEDERMAAEEVVRAFWDENPGLEEPEYPYTQNELPTDTRCAFVDFVGSLHRDGRISDETADSVTLEG